MHVFLTNDDGPSDVHYSPYIADFVEQVRKINDWELSIALPHQQRSWIGKAHLLGKNITAHFYYGEDGPGERHGPYKEPQEQFIGIPRLQEWVLLDGTPATCANIGVNHLYKNKPPVDLVISGPNFGRNTSAAYILSSGTVGAAMEGAMCGKKAIALSYSYTKQNHPPEDITAASELSVKIINHLLANWDDGVQVYSINVPMGQLGPETPIRFVPQLENVWSSVFEPFQTEDGTTEFKWSPKFSLCDETVVASGPGSDAWTVMNGGVSITPLRAAFMPVLSAEGKTLDINHL